MIYSKETHPLMDDTEIAYENAILEAAKSLSGAAKDTLVALVENGPLYDGDVPSKSGRNELLHLRILGKYQVITKALVKGEDGFQVATYTGASLYKALFTDDPYSVSIREAKAARLAKRAITVAMG
jgi:hypothetical protein